MDASVVELHVQVHAKYLSHLLVHNERSTSVYRDERLSDT